MKLQIKNYSQLAAALGVDARTLRRWRTEPDAPTTLELGAWIRWRTAKAAVEQRGRPSGSESSELAELKRKLVYELGRKESAIASLRELEAEQQRKNLKPKADIQNFVERFTGGLRALLEGMPQDAARLANSDTPATAEAALQDYLSERVLPLLTDINSKARDGTLLE
jgi:hypothetical protein